MVSMSYHRSPAWATFISKIGPNSSSFRSSQPSKRYKRVNAHTPRSRPGLSVRACANSDNTEAKEKPKEQSKAQEYLQILRQITEAETALSNPYGTKMSHEIVRFDEDGIGPRDRYVYVEELDCIGCTHCQTTASGTFFMEDDFGRARVFNQTGDAEVTVEEAIDTCPVNCIYYVDWEDLVNLEIMRADQVINNRSRLVGGQDLSSTRKGKVKTKVMDSGLMRCESCPARGCKACPLYGVGKNPEYLRQKAAWQAQKANRMEDDRKRRRRKI